MRTETPINELFLANMTQLWRVDSRLAQAVDDLPPDASLTVTQSRSGHPTASITTHDGRTISLHSRYDPVREAREFVANLDKTDDQPRGAGSACVVLSGIGLGYHLKAIHSHFGPQTVVIVSEPDLVTLKTALETLDLSAELATGRVILLNRLDKSHLHERLQPHATSLMLGTLLAVPPASRDHHAGFHMECRSAVTDFAAFAKMSVVTLIKNAGVTCRNIACNLPTYVSTPPADLLRHRFTGYPAILVAAGPSLARNIDQLPALQDKAIIIAAQTTVRPLLAQGVRPHFVTSLDFSDLSAQFFQNLDIPENLVLVAEPKAAWQAIDAFRGDSHSNPRRVILLDNRFAHKCVGEHLARRTPMEAGATVMHLAYYLAQWLGCDPIILIGQDLGFGGHVYYAPGVTMHRAWTPELGRYGTLEMKEWERIMRQGTILRKVKDIHDREIYTDEQMFTYLQQFERDFAKSTAKIIDATEGGARKAGTVVQSLAEAANSHCRKTIPDDRFDYLRMPWHDRGRLALARAQLESRISELSDFRALCEETRDLLTEMKGLVAQPRQFNSRVVRVDELRTLVQSRGQVFQMVRDVAQLGELQRIAADHRRDASEALAQGSDHQSENTARALQQVERDLSFVASLLDGCDLLDDILRKSIDRFDRELEK